MTAPRETVGVLGGSFDPVHNGHLAMAERALACFRLSRVLMLPTARPPHKAAAALTPWADRAAMVELAIAGHPRLELSTLESDERVSYTVDTLRSIREQSRDPVFVLGSDSLFDLPTWSEAERLVETFDLCVFDRTAADPRELRDRVAPFIRERMVPVTLDGGVAQGLEDLAPGRGGRVFLVPMEPVDVSSSDVRSTIADGGDPAGLVPPSVARYIHANGLYRADGGRALSNPVSPALVHCAEAALDKKAEELVILDLQGLSDVTDHFVICHGNSDRQVLAIADGIEERLLKELRMRPANVEGRSSAQWVLMDYIDFVVHVFLAERREFYRLESLWGDAKRLDVGGLGATSAAS